MSDDAISGPPTAALTEPHALHCEAVIGILDTDSVAGLSSRAGSERLSVDGPNDLRPVAAESRWVRVFAQFRSPLIVLLGVAIIVSLLAWMIDGSDGWPVDAIVIAVIVSLNGVLGYAQEQRAEDAVAELRRLASPSALVVRDGARSHMPVTEIVVGDIVLIREGDVVPADGRIVESHSLGIAEASLTGESEPSPKGPEKVAPKAALADRSSMVYASTFVVRGTARFVVTGTGMGTEVGAIAGLLVATEEAPTPLEKEVARIGRSLGIVVIAVSVVVIAATWLVSDIDTPSKAVEMLLIGVSLAVAAVPEGLPAVLSLVLAIGTRRMAKRNAIVKRLAFAETLGSTSVICTDKTGTLTRNEMSVRCLVTRDTTYTRDDEKGYEPVGGFTADDGPHNQADAVMLLRSAALASDADIVDSDTGWAAIGDPTEASLVAAAYGAGLDVGEIRANTRRLDEMPFESNRKRMSVVVSSSEAKAPIWVIEKGAPEVLVQRCAHQGPVNQVSIMDDEARDRWRDVAEHMASDGLRTLAVAMTHSESRHQPAVDGPHELTLLGIIGIQDPPRREVAKAIADARRAGIRVIMITGDHPRTANRIAQDVGIGGPDNVVTTGQALDSLADGDTVIRSDVFARVAPRHKLDLVRALQERGHVVAMTGDGVNDAPALKAADIGIAMGIAGSDVSKGAADMILVDDDFSTIVAAVEEGRAIFENVSAFLRYLLSSNTGEVLTMFIGVVAASVIGLDGTGGVIAPLLATQILWINLLTDTGPALALGVEPVDADVMKRAPRSASSRLVGRSMVGSIMLFGTTMAGATLLMVDAKLPGGLIEGHSDLREARTVGFTVLVVAQLFNAFNARSETRSAFSGLTSNPWLLATIAISAALQVMVVHIGFLNGAFNTTPLSLVDWMWCTVAGSAVLWVGELQVLWRRVRRTREAGRS